MIPKKYGHFRYTEPGASTNENNLSADAIGLCPEVIHPPPPSTTSLLVRAKHQHFLTLCPPVQSSLSSMTGLSRTSGLSNASTCPGKGLERALYFASHIPSHEPLLYSSREKWVLAEHSVRIETSSSRNDLVDSFMMPAEPLVVGESRPLEDPPPQQHTPPWTPTR